MKIEMFIEGHYWDSSKPGISVELKSLVAAGTSELQPTTMHIVLSTSKVEEVHKLMRDRTVLTFICEELS